MPERLCPFAFTLRNVWIPTLAHSRKSSLLAVSSRDVRLLGLELCSKPSSFAMPGIPSHDIHKRYMIQPHEDRLSSRCRTNLFYTILDYIIRTILDYIILYSTQVSVTSVRSREAVEDTTESVLHAVGFTNVSDSDLLFTRIKLKLSLKLVMLTIFVRVPAAETHSHVRKCQRTADENSYHHSDASNAVDPMVAITRTCNL